jgi:hypothetical protein
MQVQRDAALALSTKDNRLRRKTLTGRMVSVHRSVAMATDSQNRDSTSINRTADESIPIWKRLTRNQLFFLAISVLVTTLLLIISSRVEHSEFSFLSAPFHDLALLAGSLGFFDSLKEFFFREDYEKQKKDLLDMATTRFIREMDGAKNVYSTGIRGIRDSFDTSTLRSIILDLKAGDTLYCHDGSIADFSRLKEAIKSKAVAGVNFRFMSIAPYCKNAQRRGDELDEEVEDYSSGCKKFASTIESIRTELGEQQASGELDDLACKERVKIKLYRSLMSIPFYLVVRNNKPTIAITGFYLRTLSSSAIHIEWEALTKYKHSASSKDPDHKPHIAEDSSFITALWDYWRFKWREGCSEYERAKRLEGKWKYKSYPDSEREKPIYEGECTIREDAGSLRASGKRLKTHLKGANGEWSDDFISTNIQWTTEVMHKYMDNGKLCLITSHKCYPQEGDWASKGITAFMQLALNEDAEIGASSEAANRLDGTFFLTGKPEDTLFQARTGTVVFERQDR